MVYCVYSDKNLLFNVCCEQFFTILVLFSFFVVSFRIRFKIVLQYSFLIFVILNLSSHIKSWNAVNDGIHSVLVWFCWYEKFLLDFIRSCKATKLVNWILKFHRTLWILVHLKEKWKKSHLFNFYRSYFNFCHTCISRLFCMCLLRLIYNIKTICERVYYS